MYGHSHCFIELIAEITCFLFFVHCIHEIAKKGVNILAMVINPNYQGGFGLLLLDGCSLGDFQECFLHFSYSVMIPNGKLCRYNTANG